MSNRDKLKAAQIRRARLTNDDQKFVSEMRKLIPEVIKNSNGSYEKLRKSIAALKINKDRMTPSTLSGILKEHGFTGKIKSDGSILRIDNKSMYQWDTPHYVPDENKMVEAQPPSGAAPRAGKGVKDDWVIDIGSPDRTSSSSGAADVKIKIDDYIPVPTQQGGATSSLADEPKESPNDTLEPSTGAAKHDGQTSTTEQQPLPSAGIENEFKIHNTPLTGEFKDPKQGGNGDRLQETDDNYEDVYEDGVLDEGLDPRNLFNQAAGRNERSRDDEQNFTSNINQRMGEIDDIYNELGLGDSGDESGNEDVIIDVNRLIDRLNKTNNNINDQLQNAQERKQGVPAGGDVPGVLERGGNMGGSGGADAPEDIGRGDNLRGQLADDEDEMDEKNGGSDGSIPSSAASALDDPDGEYKNMGSALGQNPDVRNMVNARRARAAGADVALPRMKNGIKPYRTSTKSLRQTQKEERLNSMYRGRRTQVDLVRTDALNHLRSVTELLPSV